MLIALRATALPTDAEPPRRLRVAPWGESESVRGPVRVNAVTAAELPRLQAATNFDRVALDFQHNTVPGTEAYAAEREPRKVAAYGTPRVIPGEGLFLDELEWTPEGREAYAGRHYPDVSPAVKQAADGTVIFIHSAGLVRQGAIIGLHAFSATPDPVERLHPQPENLSTMDPKQLLLLLLGLGEDADAEAIATAARAAQEKLAGLDALTEQVAELAAQLEALKQGGPDGAGQDAPASISALSADLRDLSAKVNGLETRAEQAERELLIRDAIAAGKIVPHSVDKLSLEQARALLAELPAGQVPTDRRTPEGVKAYASSAVLQAEDSAAAEICRQLGIKREDFDKHRQSAA